MGWSLLQGVMAGGSMLSECPTLQIMSATFVMALQGSLCTRNFSVPRFAMTILCAADLPFVAGAALSKDHWLLVISVVTPSYLYASYATVKRFQTLALQAYREQFLSQEAAVRDPLTGALNRRGLRQAMDEDIGDALLTVFYLDLDGFKMVNDLHGHTAGDQLLRGVVRRLRLIIRDDDILGRVGGDEFIIIAPSMPPEAAEAFAARLVAELTAHVYPLGKETSTRIGVSVGYACAPEDSTSLPELTHMADVALYAVKKNGKGSWQRVATCGVG
jgi:diguanylate cyclase (GGDEF)-like protein